jgi:hypothetical protein
MAASGRRSRTVRVSGSGAASKVVRGLGSAISMLLLREVVLVEGGARTIRVGHRFGRESRRERREPRHREGVEKWWMLG